MNKKLILPILTFIMAIVVLARLFVCCATENNTSTATISKDNLLHIQQTDDNKEEPELETESTAASTSDEFKSEEKSFSAESDSSTFFSAETFGTFSVSTILASTVIYFIYSLLTGSMLNTFASAVCKFFSKETTPSPAFCKA